MSRQHERGASPVDDLDRDARVESTEPNQQHASEVSGTEGVPVDEAAGGDEFDLIPAMLRNHTWFATALLLLSLVGLVSSFMLTLEYIHKLQDAQANLICDINVFVTCAPAMQSTAGRLFGFPNIIIGLVGFTVPITTAMAMFAGARMRSWYWIGMQLGMIFAGGLITYLQWFSAFELGRLCLWCMIIWAGTIPLVTLVTFYNGVHGHLGAGAARVFRRIAYYWWVAVILWVFAVIGMIFVGMGPLIANQIG